jgi:hypothetical protein
MPPHFQYLTTQLVGQGTVAGTATRALANLLAAAGKTSNVCGRLGLDWRLRHRRQAQQPR